jgi:PIN domain nuclease of toxin-antitoxin system
MSKYLLDTHTIIDYLREPEKLTHKAEKILFNDKDTIVVSMASFWEMGIKLSIGKLKLNSSLKDIATTLIRDYSFEILQIKFEHIYKQQNLEFYHKDPFDRLIIAQSLVEKLPIISCDSVFDQYKVQRIWD